MQGSYEIQEYIINKEVCFSDYDKLTSFAYQQLILLIITFIITFIMIL